MPPNPSVPPQERYYTVKEAAEDYFQGKVSEREVYHLFSGGLLRGFRVGSGKGKILIYGSSLEAFRKERENPPAVQAPPPPPPPRPTRRKKQEPPIRLKRLPVE